MKSIIRKSIALTALAFLFGCGGGGGGSADSGGIGGTGVTSTGVMTKGSVVLNGVRFEDSTANILIDDTPKTAANLQNGMVVKVKGSANGVNGVAERVEAQIEVRGNAVVTALNVSSRPQTLRVLGQTVIVDDLTVVSGLSNPFDMSLNNDLVEVHGLRDTLGQIRATRIEANPGQMGDNTVDEIRGVVSGGAGTNPATFTLGAQVVNASGASIFPAGATYSNGSVVEVHCTARPCVNGSGQFVASRIEVEDAEDSAFQPGMNERFEVEGLVSGYVLPTDNDFFVAGVRVTTSGSTQFEGGLSTDMADNIKVEAEGVWNGSSLVASKIEFKRSVIRLQGVVTASTAPTFTLNIVGAGSVTVEVDDFTDGDFTNGAVPPEHATNCIEVRGQRKAGGSVVTAGEIRSSCSSSPDHLIQAPVEAEVPESTITLLGFAINVSAPTDNPPFENIDGSPMSRTEFFNAVVPANLGPPAVAGTLVKVRFDTPATTVSEVELED